MKITAIDAMCGQGKTYHAIKMMCENCDKKWIFVTPYLEEIQRVINVSRDTYNIEFTEPEDGYSKMSSFKKLLSTGKNIATTHMLFGSVDEECYDLIKSNGYSMVLDEVMQTVQVLKYHPQDIEIFEKSGYIQTNDNMQYLSRGSKYDGDIDSLKGIIKLAKNRRIFKYSDKVYLWLFPAELIDCVDELYILSYLFECQIMAVYLKVYGFEYELKTCTREEGFIDYIPANVSAYSSLIEVFHKPRYDRDDQNETDYSASWWKQALKNKSIEEERKILYSFFFNYCDRNADLNGWTVFKGDEVDKDADGIPIGELQKKMSGKGYTKGFISSSARATNDYAHKANMAYMINKYQNPIIENFFKAMGFTIDQKQRDEFALSEMVQWIFRSRIRNKEKIKLLIRSKRMRRLFEMWMIYGRVI